MRPSTHNLALLRVLRTAVPAVILLALSIFFLFTTGIESTRAETRAEGSLSSLLTPEIHEPIEAEVVNDEPTVEKVIAEDPGDPIDPNTVLDQYMKICEERIDTVKLDSKGNVIKKKRRRYTKADQREMRRHIGIVAREMGAEPKLLWIWALRESSYRPYKRHRLNPDMEAAYSAWQRFRYTESRERRYRDIMRTHSAKDGTDDFWKAKAGLKRISVYKDNPTYEAMWRWSTGYGLYGMQPIYHVKRWDPNAPPEILCDPVVATVTAVWAARQIRDTCSSMGFPGTYETVNRGYSSGHCKLRPSWAKYFRRRADRAGLDATGLARLGKAWLRKTTDRDEVLAHMRAKIAEDDARVAEEERKREERKKRRLARNKSKVSQG